ncbi:MAG TPA: Holliday junction branch migration protein RuvA [Candidatus Egerieousia sp.]|nr:Holliday junction branch migration protein RuvA [Candidatus Egerieousia sp.]HPT05568.1 Holliday junction branch migration protein RuvA [Candidatus Egerieousia sp.]
MYDYIKGQLAEVTPTQAIVETGGIGYKLEISLQTFTDIQSLKDVKLFIYYHVKEDIAMWYGFYTKAERDMFMKLINVNGIGPNTARMMLSSLSSDELKNAIISGDVDKIKSIKGIGLKTAQRVIIDLKDRIVKGGDTSMESLIAGGAPKTQAAQEALSALVMLGFNKAAAEKVINGIVKENPQYTLEELVKHSLKHL